MAVSEREKDNVIAEARAVCREAHDVILELQAENRMLRDEVAVLRARLAFRILDGGKDGM